MRLFYRAYCTRCGYTHKENRDDSRFMYDPFMPERCRNCGAKSASNRVINDLWEVSYGYWRRSKMFNALRPSTWFSGWVWVDFDKESQTNE